MQTRVISYEMINDFEKQLYNDERNQATVAKYIHDVLCFARFANGQQVDKALTLSYKAELEQQYAIASANSMIAALNAFLRFVGWLDCCIKQFKVQKKAYCSEEKELTKEEYIRLVRTAEQKHNERLCLILQTICGTGIRVGELQYITAEAVRKGEAIVSCKNKTRTVFIVRELQKKLLRYMKEHNIVSGCVFITKTGKPMSRTNIWREMKSLCEQAGVSPDKVFPHNLRHLFARIFYSIDKDIAKLADILGQVVSIPQEYTLSQPVQSTDVRWKTCA